MRLVLLGPPGVGKGTLAARLSRRTGATVLSTGELLRAALRPGGDPALAESARVILSGEFVSDFVATELILGRLQGLSRFVLDGFPRTAPQAHALETFLEARGIPLDAAMLLDAPEAVVAVRIAGRRVCAVCGAGSSGAGRCVRCGGVLILRPEEDDPAKAGLRRRLYEERTRPVITFYRDRGTLFTLEASGDSDAVERAACEALSVAV